MTDGEYSRTTESVGSTVGAIILGGVLAVPGYFLAGLVVLVYHFFTAMGMARYGEGGSWIPFLDGIFHILWMYLLPEGIRGAVGVLLALYVGRLVFKKADVDKTAFTVCGIWITLCVLLLLFSFVFVGFDIKQFGVIGIAIGIGVGGAIFRDQVR